MKKIIYSLSFLLILTAISCGSTKNSSAEKNTEMTKDINIMPQSGPSPSIRFSKPIIHKLANGLTIIVVENHKLPNVNASLRIDNQPLRLRDKKGSDDLLSALLGSGSKNVSKDQFNEKTDFYGAFVSLYDGGFNINALSKYFPEILQLTIDQVLHPVFSEEEFNTEKKKAEESLKMDEKNTPSIAHSVTNKLAYGDHPYGEFTSQKTLKNVNLEDVKKYYHKNFAPNNAYLIVVGDVKASDINKIAEKEFKDWMPAPQNKPLSLPAINAVTSTEIDFINMPNAEQTELAVVQRSDIRRNNPDYQKVLLMNAILGGDFNSYLNMTLREEHGWTYGARSNFGTDKYGSIFKASTSIRNTVADSAVTVTLAQINKIINEKVDSTTLANNKAKYVGSFVLQMEKPATIANQAYNMLINNLPEDYYKNFLKKLDAVSVEDIQAVAQKYLHPNQLRIVMAGKASITVPGLEKAGYKINFYNKNGELVEKPKMHIKIPDGVTTQSVLDHYFEAIGGKKKINNIKSVFATYETDMQGQVLQQEIKKMTPNKSAMAIKMGDMTLQKIVFDGAKGYQEAQGQKVDLDAETAKKMKEEVQPFSEMPLYKTGKLDRVENIDGTNYYVIKGADKTDYYFDSKTGYKTKEVKYMSVAGKERTQPITLSDYKSFNGIKFPGKISLSFGPQKMEFTLKDIKVNTLSNQDFK